MPFPWENVREIAVSCILGLISDKRHMSGQCCQVIIWHTTNLKMFGVFTQDCCMLSLSLIIKTSDAYCNSLVLGDLFLRASNSVSFHCLRFADCTVALLMINETNC